MGLLTFKGGLHPYDGKELSKDKPIKEYLPQGELVYPLSQHIGAPAVACVKKGDHVLVGQKIAEAGGFVSANIHSSVSGTVKKIEPRMTVAGNKVMSIVVENDGQYETVDFAPVKEMTKDNIIAAIKEAGVIGLGGAGFPTHVKLAPKEPDKIDHIIINAAECEPYITADYRCMMEIPEQLISGLKIILSMFPNAKGVIGIEDNKPDAIKKLQGMVKDEERIEVAPLKTKYPQGAERSLIYAVTGRSINSSMLPADAGCIVDNVATAIAIHEAVTLGKPLYERVVTVTGDAIAEPQNFKVKSGTNIAELAEAAGGFKKQPKKVISGGPMMGMALSKLDIPCGKSFSSLLCFVDDPADVEPSACIHCGRCVDVCPAHLMPTKLSQIADHGDYELFDQLDGCECVECGCCSYICPAKRRLTQSMKTGRRMALAARRAKKAK
ncbi:MAG: electron transport complex subunit RsxC [Lachnospiraceae bacterium]|nr:electron transport complex subunit RsxC [Lachnospiraceae bacterium]